MAEELNYLRDARTMAGRMPRWYGRVSRDRREVEFPAGADLTQAQMETFPGRTDEEGLLWVAVEWQTCPLCEGRGQHVNPSIDASGLGPEDFAEDPDFAEEYVKGRYDVPCARCKGERVVPVPTDPKVRVFVQEYADDVTESLNIEAMERAMGA